MKKLSLIVILFALHSSAFAQGVESVTINANGTVLNRVPSTGLPKTIKYATGQLEVNGVAVVGGPAGVTSVSGTAPIVSSGGLTPAISITAATTGAPGSMSAADKTKLDGIAAGAQPGTVTSVTVTGANGVMVLGSPITTSGTISLSLGGITPTSVAASGAVSGSNLSGTNTGDQTSIVGITGTTAEFNTALSDANFATGGGTATGTNTGDQDLSALALKATTISTTAPLTGGGDLSTNRTFAISDAAADATTKGASTYTAADFNATAGLISLDYTNGQAASGSTKGFLISADWTTFNNKAPLASPTFTGTVTIPTPFTLGAVSVLPTGTELNFVDGVTSAIQTQLDAKAPLVSPSFTTPNINVATGTSLALGSDPADAGVLRLENAAVIGWEASPAGTDVTLTANSSEQFVFSNAILSPTLVTPALGTPASGVMTNMTGTAAGLTAGTATALATARTINGVSFDGTANITTHNPLTVYAAGTAYTLTGSTAALDFGTTDPVITVNQAGTYLIFARVVAHLPTSAGNEQAVFGFKLRRTNNTAADIANSVTEINTTPDTVRDFASVITLPPVVYTTALTNDSLTIFGADTGAAPVALVTEASIVTIRIQ